MPKCSHAAPASTQSGMYRYVTDDVKEVVLTLTVSSGFTPTTLMASLLFFMSIPLRIKPILVIEWQMNILFANELTLMEVLFPLSTTINCRVCRTCVASGVWGRLMHAKQNATKLLTEGRCDRRATKKTIHTKNTDEEF